MFRVNKVLNNNCVLATDMEQKLEVIILGRGAGFGKKVSERFEVAPESKVYRLQAETRTDNPVALAKTIDTEVFELTGEILEHGRQQMGGLDDSILLSLADHISFAVKRLKKGESIHNPLTDEVRMLFDKEYQAACFGGECIERRLHVKVNADELGYIAMHLHVARSKEKMEDVLLMTQLVQDAIAIIKQERNVEISEKTTAYSRLVSHMKYMILRLRIGERLTLDVNDFMQSQMPDTFALAKKICLMIEARMKDSMTFTEIPVEEIGYLAMHIERVCQVDSGSK